MTPAQLTTLRAAIFASANPAVIAARQTNDDTGLAALYNLPSTYVAWRTDVTRAQIYHSTSDEGTTWDWTKYVSQSLSEQNAWVQIFMGDQANFSLDNLRAGVNKIFSGAGSAAQRAHIAAIAKRQATEAEKVFATTGGGVGTTQLPGKMTWEGAVSPQNMSDALASA
jgi:hypothetical protein